MTLLDKEAGRWYCHHDDQLFFDKEKVWKPEITSAQLEDARESLRRRREKQAELGQVIIVALSKHGEVEEELDIERVSKVNRGGQALRSIAGIAGGGPIGYIGVKGLEAVFGKKMADKIEERIEKDPYRYPYCAIRLRMFCPKCRTQVRADGRFCEGCGSKYEIPVPEYVWV